MKTKIIYVVVANKDSIYLEQAYVSVWSLKYYNPDVHVTFVMDDRTKTYWDACGYDELKTLVDDIIVKKFDDNATNHYRSRWLKTSLRMLVKGDYLFLDTDTIVQRDISDIDLIDHNICACWDTHSLFKTNPYSKLGINDVKKLGIDISNEDYYYNSGVIYVKDTTEAYEFYTLWNSNYNKGVSKGVVMDQPSFAISNITLNYPVKKLSDYWNCELKHGIRWLKDAYIIHYLCTNTSHNADCQFFWLNDRNAFREIKETSQIPLKIKEIINDPFKGIAEITHCFAGTDIYFFRTNTYNTFNNLFHKKGNRMMIERIIILCQLIKNKVFKFR